MSTLLREQANLFPVLIGAIGTFGPFVAATLITGWRSGSSGVQALLAKGLRWRLGWRGHGVVLGLPPVILLLALVLHRAIGGTVPAFFVVNHWVLLPLSFAINLALGGALGEEFGWRGFLLPLLQSRLSALLASMVIGVIWAFWYLPLFLIPGQLQQHLPFGLYVLNTIALSILFTWTYNSTGGSVFSAILLHTSVDYWSGVIPVLPHAAGSVQPFAIAVLLIWVVALSLVGQVDARSVTKGYH
ncbi:MAG: CPBP family intramembrane metalloprotease [Oscillatoriales cyanobacterium C42_A2020_001]|nr:CPBP family intramembrane metalloprotease [Leptolyngbyaceae cyanobacterium C42_A2020_001]